MRGTLLTVVNPAASLDLTTLGTAKEELNIRDGSQDSKLQRWIHDASAQVADYLDRVLGLETVTETFHPGRLYGWGNWGGGWGAGSHSWGGRGGSLIGTEHVLQLVRWPVAAIESISIDGTLLNNPPANPVVDYAVDTAAGRLYRTVASGITSDWYGAEIAVTYQAGYALLDDLPRAIEQATLTLLRHRFAAGSRDPTLKSEDVPGIYSVSYWVGTQGAGPLPPEVCALLDPYREAR